MVPTWTAADLKAAGLARVPMGAGVAWVLALPGEPAPPERRAPQSGLQSMGKCARCGGMYVRRRGCFCRFGMAPV